MRAQQLLPILLLIALTSASSVPTATVKPPPPPSPALLASSTAAAFTSLATPFPVSGPSLPATPEAVTDSLHFCAVLIALARALFLCVDWMNLLLLLVGGAWAVGLGVWPVVVLLACPGSVRGIGGMEWAWEGAERVKAGEGLGEVAWIEEWRLGAAVLGDVVLPGLPDSPMDVSATEIPRPTGPVTPPVTPGQPKGVNAWTSYAAAEPGDFTRAAKALVSQPVEAHGTVLRETFKQTRPAAILGGKPRVLQTLKLVHEKVAVPSVQQVTPSPPAQQVSALLQHTPAPASSANMSDADTAAAAMQAPQVSGPAVSATAQPVLLARDTDTPRTKTTRRGARGQRRHAAERREEAAQLQARRTLNSNGW